jgi:general secretion pathway protein C
MPISAQLRGFQDLTAQQWLDRISRTVPLALSLLLVVAIAWQLVQLTWLLLDQGERETAPAAIAAPPPGIDNIPRKGPDIQAIVNAHLFGVQQAPADANPAEAPQTQMNLVLSAVFANSDPSKGMAIIGESTTAAEVFAVGQAVRPGTKLHAVYPDKVILDRGGQLEALLLPAESMAGLMSQPAARPMAGGNRFTENLRRIAENNPSAFAEIVRPQPVFANGVQRGYRVYPGRNRQQFAKLGLQPGDLVLAVNGTPLDDPQRGMEIFNTMGSSDRVTVSVERNGQAQDLTLNIAQISLPEEGGPGTGQNPPTRVTPPPVPDGAQPE